MLRLTPVKETEEIIGHMGRWLRSGMRAIVIKE